MNTLVPVRPEVVPLEQQSETMATAVIQPVKLVVTGNESVALAGEERLGKLDIRRQVLGARLDHFLGLIGDAEDSLQKELGRVSEALRRLYRTLAGWILDRERARVREIVAESFRGAQWSLIETVAKISGAYIEV